MPVTLPSDPTTRPEEDLNLEFDWDKDPFRPKPGLAAILSILFHLLLGTGLMLAPASLFDSHPAQILNAPQIERKVTRLVAPRMELTQKEPNKGPVKQEANLAELTANIKQQKAPRTYIPPPSPAQKAEAAPKQFEAPPQITAPVDTKELAQLGSPQMPVPIAPNEQVKRSPFENVGQAAGAKKGAADGRIPQMPRQTIEDMMRQSAKESTGSSGVMVTDFPPLTNPMQPQNRIGSSLELLSDPQGVDFRPYLAKILAIVKRNWLAVIPESAHFGRRGKTIIQFSISRDGRVPKLVIAGPSGTEALDRAAVAGISASNPFPPLPADFKGDIVKLQFGFAYNVQ